MYRYMEGCDRPRWMMALCVGRTYMQGFLDGRDLAGWRCWWMGALMGEREYMLYLDGYVRGVLSLVEGALPPERLN